MDCPQCGGRLRPHGNGRTRSVREMGSGALKLRPAFRYREDRIV